MKKIFLSIVLLSSGFLFAQEKWSIEECISYAAKNNLTIQNNQLNEQLSA